MRRRFGADSEQAKTRKGKTLSLKRTNRPKALRTRTSSDDNQETEVQQVTSELRDALEQLTTTAEILEVIRDSPNDAEAGLPAICVETRHMKAALSAQINKSDRNEVASISASVATDFLWSHTNSTLEVQTLKNFLERPPHWCLGAALSARRNNTQPDWVGTLGSGRCGYACCLPSAVQRRPLCRQFGRGATRLASDWQIFKVPDYGTRLEYPASIFSAAGQAEAGVGQRFESEDRRAVLSIYARENEDGDTPASYLKKNLRQSGLQYERVTRSFFAISMERGRDNSLQPLQFLALCSTRHPLL